MLLVLTLRDELKERTSKICSTSRYGLNMLSFCWLADDDFTLFVDKFSRVSREVCFESIEIGFF